ncbi:beta strand repeat-containing protein, partial [Roseobacter sp. HKCCA2468]|uniref:beta strand repeat-containing protein n=1 Tax=Roseobacter sp. HKCCA2468 TaxID=3120342 RepID=UPI0030EB1F60
MVDDLTKLRFEYTVQQDDINTRELKVTGLAERGAKITDQAGNEALVEINPEQLNYTTAVIDTKAPTKLRSTDNFIENDDGLDVVRDLRVVTFKFEANEAIEFDLSAIDYGALNAQTREELGLSPDATDEEMSAAIAEAIEVAEQAVILGGFDVSFTGSRSDENGFVLQDLSGDLSVANFRRGMNADGVDDGSSFFVDVVIPDRSLGDLTVSVLPNALRDLATNENVIVYKQTQSVDTQTVNIDVIPAAGLFIGARSNVQLYDAKGRELTFSQSLVPETGQVRFAVGANELYPAGYRGAVLVEVTDTDAAPDYIDEFTGQGVSLSDGVSSSVMRAVFNVNEPGDVAVTVSPVTELAVRKLLEEVGNPSEMSPLEAVRVDQFNSGVAKIFGLGEIVKTQVTVVNSALVESATGVDVADFDAADGISASEKYGQVLAMLSSRDSQTGSMASTLDELTGQIKAITSGGTTQLAIKQAGADQLVEALTVSEADVALDQSGVNRGLLDVAYIEEAAASGYGLNLAEAETATVPVKGAQLGDTVVVQWGTIQNPDLLAEGETLGDANTFTVVITEADIDADGNVRVPVPLNVIEKQGDASEVAVRNAIIPAGATNEDGSPKTEVTEDDYQAPVLLTVDIIPPQTTVAAPDAAAPFVTRGDVEGIRGGDDLNILLNNSADEQFKYALNTNFLDEYETLYTSKLAEELAGAVDPSNPTVAERNAAEAAAEAHALANMSGVPAGLQVSNVAQDAASGTWTFDWSLDLTQAISVAEAAAQAAAEAAGESYTPLPTFTADDERSVFQVQASTADLVGNADADDARNEVIIGSVNDIVDSPAEQQVMGEALNRLSTRYGDDAVDTRAEIQTIANAIDGVSSLEAAGDAEAVVGAMTRASQTLVLGGGGSVGSPGAVAQGVHNLVIGEQTYTLDLSDNASPTVADVISAIQGETGYADLPYTVSADASGNGVAVQWKAFGPQPAAVADVVVTTTQTATQLSATITQPGSLFSFAEQAIALEGTTDAETGVFAPAVGDVDLAFGGVTVSASVAEGDTLADVLTALQGESDYSSLPFALAINESGDGFTATWKQIQSAAVTEQITVDRAFEVTTTTETTATIVEAGAAGLTTAGLTALDIQNVDDSELAAIARAIASDRASVSAPVVSFADVTMAAGETTTATLTFATRVGQVPDDALALIGGSFSTEGAEGAPIWTSTDGLTWTASFTASSAIANTGLTYTEQTDADGNVILDDNGNPVLEPVVVDATTDPVTYDIPASALSQVAITEALVNRVTGASATVAAFADTQGASASPAPSVQDFADMAVAGVRDDNLSAVLDALASVRDRFEGEGDLYTQIQTVADSYNAVFNTVYAQGDQPTATDLIEDLTNLGVSNLSSDAARAEDQTTLLQGALQAVAAAKADVTNGDGSTTTAAEQQAGMINSVAKLESFVASAERVLARANGETSGGGTPVPVSAMTLKVVHATSGYPDSSAEYRSMYINAGEDISVRLETAGGTVTARGIAASRDDLQSVVDGLNADLAGTGYEVSVAGGELTFIRTDEAPFTLVLERPTNSPIYGRLINTETNEELYPDNDGEPTSSSSRTLGASGAPVQVSDTDLAALGFESLLADTAGNSRLTSLQKVLADQAVGDGSAAVTDYADLKTLLDTASNAFDGIVGLTAAAQGSYTDDAAHAAAIAAAAASLTPDSFKAMGVDGVTDVSISGIADATEMSGIVLEALIKTPDSIDSFEAIQALVDNYTQVLSVASGEVTGTDAVITAAQFTNLGVALSSDDAQEPSALAELLSGIIANKASPAGGNATDNVDSISELQALANAAKKVFDSAALSADPAAGDAGILATQTDLNTLGFDTVDADNLDAIQRVLVRNAADRDAVKDYADLKSLIDAAVDAHTALTDVVATAQSGSAPDLSGLDETDFAAMGIDAVDSDTVSAVLDALTRTPNTVTTAGDIQTIVDSYNAIFDVAEIDTGSFTQADLANIGITLADGLSDNDASLASGVIAELSFTEVDTVDKVQGIVDAIDAVFANAARTSDDDTTNTVTVTKDQLLTLGFYDPIAEEVTDENLDAIQRVLTDLADEDGIADYANLRTLIEDAIIAHQDILDAVGYDATGVTTDTYAEMGIDGVDAGNLAAINDALVSANNPLVTAAQITAADVQTLVDSYNHILDLREVGATSTIVLDANDFTDLGVTLKAAGAEQTQQLAYLQEIIKTNLGSGDIATVAGLQDLADATSDLIDMIQGVSPDSDGVTGLTPDQFALLGINDGSDPAGPITAAQADMLSKRLALTADDLSDVTNLATDLKGLWDAATASMAKIKAYAESDATADFDTSGSFDSGDVPTVDDFKNIGVVDYAAPVIVETPQLSLDSDGALAINGSVNDRLVQLEVNSSTYYFEGPLSSSVSDRSGGGTLFNGLYRIYKTTDGSFDSDDYLTIGEYNEIVNYISDEFGITPKAITTDESQEGSVPNLGLNDILLDNPELINVGDKYFFDRWWDSTDSTAEITQYTVTPGGWEINLSALRDKMNFGRFDLNLDGSYDASEYHTDDFDGPTLDQIKIISETDTSLEFYAYAIVDNTDISTLPAGTELYAWVRHKLEVRDDGHTYDLVPAQSGSSGLTQGVDFGVSNSLDTMGSPQMAIDPQTSDYSGIVWTVGDNFDFGDYLNNSAFDNRIYYRPDVTDLQFSLDFAYDQPQNDRVTSQGFFIDLTEELNSDGYQQFLNSAVISPAFSGDEASVYRLDISDSSFDTANFSVTLENGSSVTDTSIFSIQGTPGTAGAYIELRPTESVSGQMTLSSDTGLSLLLDLSPPQRVVIDARHINSINELFAVASVGADNG